MKNIILILSLVIIKTKQIVFNAKNIHNFTYKNKLVGVNLLNICLYVLIYIVGKSIIKLKFLTLRAYFIDDKISSTSVKFQISKLIKKQNKLNQIISNKITKQTKIKKVCYDLTLNKFIYFIKIIINVVCFFNKTNKNNIINDINYYIKFINFLKNNKLCRIY